MRTRAGCLLLCALALGCVTPQGAAPPPALPPVADAAGRPAQVVLVSVAGLTADRFLSPDTRMPTLTALAARGVSAEQVETVPAAGVYPAHATLVTGVTPSVHGIVADHLLGERGVRLAAPSHASQLRAPTLWQRVAESGASVTSLDWPTTTGAEIAALLPDVAPLRAGERWTTLAAGAASAGLAERITAAPGAVEQPGAARDALLIDLACASFAGAPRLVLLRLRGPEALLAALGPHSAEAAAAFATVDAELRRLLECAERAGVLPHTAFVVTGDQAFAPVHTALRPNAWLREAGWITPQGHWRAFARSNGGSAFVYAEEARIAVPARQKLEARGRESGVFRVVGADEMIARGADPDAWFGLEAEPGFVFENGADGAPFGAAAVRGSAGTLGGAAAPGVGLVAFGRGFRRGVRVSRMSQLDVAPTLAALLGVSLEGATGRNLIGLLRVGTDPADAAAAQPVEVSPRER